MKNKSLFIAVAVTTAFLAACSSSSQWSIGGTIEGAAEDTLILETSDNGRWYAVDTVVTDKSGGFSLKHQAGGYPDIYRLRLDEKYLYFPIDSTESITVTATSTTFDTDYTLEGSQSAELLIKANKRINESVKANGALSLAGDSLLKRDLSQIILTDPAGVVAYYIISKSINGTPLFDATKRFDGRIIGAVANAYSNQRPLDPRTEYIKALYLNNRPRYSMSTDTIHANEIELIDIDLLDNTGKQQRLSDVASASRIVVLNFTAYTAEFSPALNVELNSLYEKYKSQGLNIYQVGYDGDEFQWRQSAKNLPWVTVYNPATIGAEYLRLYNVGGLPAVFVIKNGALVERITDAGKLTSTVAKYI